MAVLWKQRELVKELDILSKLILLRQKRELIGKKVPDRVLLVISKIGGYEHWVFENELLVHLLKKYNKSHSDIDFTTDHKRVLESCIKDGFIDKRDNDKFMDADILTNHTTENTSERLIQVNFDKGVEIINWTYFWWKYIAGVFPPVTTIVVTVITALLTSGAIWFFLWKVISNKLGLYN